jgi:glycosyltransferase involved in cell wall biosynthesis
MAQRSKLSLCMIFRDEAPFIREALESVLPIIDEAVLVDSGSSDGSDKIVADLQKSNPKIKYLHRAWPNDFADQKNYAIEQANGDWILFLDADERIDRGDHEVLRCAIERAEVMAYDLPIKNYTNEMTEIGFRLDRENVYGALGFIPTHLHRLFRKDSRIRYEGILHERIESSLEVLGAKTEPLKVVIHHLGPLKEKNLQLQSKRYAFYEDLGRRKIAAESSNPQAYWELGVVLQKQKKLREATEMFYQAMQLAPDTDEFEVYYCLSLFQQSRWDLLRTYSARSKRARIFPTVARAQIDARAIDELDQFRGDYLQVTLFIFELSLMHKRTDRIDSDRKRANELFGDTGLVEFLEGSALRRGGDQMRAREFLTLAKQKGCALAEKELALI